MCWVRYKGMLHSGHYAYVGCGLCQVSYKDDAYWLRACLDCKSMMRTCHCSWIVCVRLGKGILPSGHIECVYLIWIKGWFLGNCACIGYVRSDIRMMRIVLGYIKFNKDILFYYKINYCKIIHIFFDLHRDHGQW